MRNIKLWVVYILRTIMKILYIFPIKRNRIYFSSDRGTSISCNPKYIFQYMMRKYPGQYEYIWEYDKEWGRLEKNVKVVSPYTLKANYYMLTSKIIISNDGLGSYIPKRKKQCFINTWHGGGAYKRVGADTVDKKDVEYRINQICGKQTDIFISSCKKFSEVMAQAKAISSEKFLECGMPRNDCLVLGKNEKASVNVRKFFDLDNTVKMVLFAPTYRGTEATAEFETEIDIDRCLNALQRRFDGNWVFLMRKHHFVKKIQMKNCMDASGYPDMQELLLAVDVFMTDYSSSIWDYSLTYKPGFLFTPDLREYQSTRNFYTAPETWAFPLAESNEELEKLILDYNEEINKRKIKKHHELLGNKETGHATERIVEEILKKGCK